LILEWVVVLDSWFGRLPLVFVRSSALILVSVGSSVFNLGSLVFLDSLIAPLPSILFRLGRLP
jgi:hypothetical protein